MIVGERKDLDEIKAMIAPYKKVLIVGCDTCVSICWAGGEKEVLDLAAELRDNPSVTAEVIVPSSVDRQCEMEMVEVLEPLVKEADAVVSMACGAGAAILAEAFEDKPVLPALNTTFLGAPTTLGTWIEKCGSCGDCVLDETGGVCPVVSCAKGLLNGPCGGVRRGGWCETDPEKPCAWVQIYRRLEKQGRLDQMAEIKEPKDHNAVMRPGKVTATVRRKV